MAELLWHQIPPIRPSHDNDGSRPRWFPHQGPHHELRPTLLSIASEDSWFSSGVHHADHQGNVALNGCRWHCQHWPVTMQHNCASTPNYCPHWWQHLQKRCHLTQHIFWRSGRPILSRRGKCRLHSTRSTLLASACCAVDNESLSWHADCVYSGFKTHWPSYQTATASWSKAYCHWSQTYVLVDITGFFIQWSASFETNVSINRDWGKSLPCGATKWDRVYFFQASKGRDTLTFYTIPEYTAWKESLGGSSTGWKIRYYKGLGTSTSKEAKEYFTALEDSRKDFLWTGELIKLVYKTTIILSQYQIALGAFLHSVIIVFLSGGVAPLVFSTRAGLQGWGWMHSFATFLHCSWYPTHIFCISNQGWAPITTTGKKAYQSLQFVIQ